MDDEKAKIIGQGLTPTLQVGKDGISPEMIKEINKQVEDKKLIKIKVLRNSPYSKTAEAAEIINESCKARVVEVRGRTVLLSRR